MLDTNEWVTEAIKWTAQTFDECRGAGCSPAKHADEAIGWRYTYPFGTCGWTGCQ